MADTPDTKPAMPQALGHIRVLDLSRVLAGPWCSQNLADLGADVIKIERPGAGDDTRAWGPPYAKDADGNDTSEAAYYLAANRGKRSVTVDIASPDGQALVRELAQHADVVIENFKVGHLKRYGLDYATLKALKPDLVYCSVTGFGQDGPYAHRAGYDFLIQGMGGLMSITGERDDLPGGGPQKAGVADSFIGLRTSVTLPAAGCGSSIAMPRAFTCGLSNTSPMSLIGPQGTPTASSRAIQSSRVRALTIAASSGTSVSRCCTRSGLVAKRASAARSGRSPASTNFRYWLSLPVATMMWPSAQAKVW